MTTFISLLAFIFAVLLAVLGSFCLAIGLRLFKYKNRYPIMTKECLVFNEKENRLEVRYGISNDAVKKNLS